jgi:hypothetical protein
MMRDGGLWSSVPDIQMFDLHQGGHSMQTARVVAVNYVIHIFQMLEGEHSAAGALGRENLLWQIGDGPLTLRPRAVNQRAVRPFHHHNINYNYSSQQKERKGMRHL